MQFSSSAVFHIHALDSLQALTTLDLHSNSTQVIHPSPEPAGMTSFLAVSLPLDSCPEKTGELLLVPIGSRKVRLETDWKITGIVRKHPTGIRRQRTSQKRLGNGRKRRKSAESDTEIAGTGRLSEVPATGLIDLGIGADGARHLREALKVNQVLRLPPIALDVDTVRCLQTLTTLNLEYNEIGADGARHLAEALKVNRVMQFMYTVASACSLLFPDAQNTQYSEKQYWC